MHKAKEAEKSAHHARAQRKSCISLQTLAKADVDPSVHDHDDA